jgi:hypothetical protein
MLPVGGAPTWRITLVVIALTIHCLNPTIGTKQTKQFYHPTSTIRALANCFVSFGVLLEPVSSSFSSSTSIALAVSTPETIIVAAPEVKSVSSSSQYVHSSGTGIDFYDYQTGDPGSKNYAKLGDKITLNYKGRLAGRQGWIYDDTFNTDTPVRIKSLGSTNVIKGLELGK